MDLWDFFIGPYKEALTLHIVLEIVAIVASLVSVFFSFRNDVLVFPFGIISTIIYVYLLLQWNLLGDMLINSYYFVMSIYGWYLWSRVYASKESTPVTITRKTEWQAAAIILVAGALAVYLIYTSAARLEPWVSYVDMVTTGLFFAGMWLMARRKLEHWLVLLLGNVISVPLYVYKGYGFSAILYLILAIIAYFGYLEWEKTRKERSAGYLKVVLYGPESTGKSTLSRKLTKYYQTILIPEFAREYLQAKYDASGDSCDYEDLWAIVEGQKALEEKVIAQGHELLICDTDLLETLVYSKVYFKKVPDTITKMAQNDHVDLYLLMNIDIPWEADDLRDRPDQRESLFELFKNELVARNKEFKIISGNAQQRLETAIAAIDNLIK